MHKVVLRTSSKQTLQALSEKLTEQRNAWKARAALQSPASGEEVAQASHPDRPARNGPGQRAERENKEEDNVEEEEEFPDHVLWMEQPENVPTVLALAPNHRPPLLKKVLNKCSLLTD